RPVNGWRAISTSCRNSRQRLRNLSVSRRPDLALEFLALDLDDQHQRRSNMQVQPGKDDLLLIIDVQNDFCPGGALAVADGDAVVPVINRLAERFDHVVLTQDWHPSGHGSFATSHPGASPFDSVAMPYGQQTL